MCPKAAKLTGILGQSICFIGESGKQTYQRLMDETADKPPTPSRQRLFFALWPDESVRRALLRWCQAVPDPGGRPMPSADLHLTLAFAGDVDASTGLCLEQGGAGVQGVPFELSLDSAGVFPRGLLWAGPAACPGPLEALAGSLSCLLQRCGLKPDPRPFKPHVTLIRRVQRTPDDLPPPSVLWRVDHFCLVRSRPGRGYEVLKTYPLCGHDGSSLSECSGSMG